MHKISIYKDSVLTNQAMFATRSELDSWVAGHEEMGSFLLSDKEIRISMPRGEDLVSIKSATHAFEIVDMTAEIQANAWIKARQDEYYKIDSMLLEAIAEKEAGRPEKMEAYLALREQIRLDNPKPSEE